MNPAFVGTKSIDAASLKEFLQSLTAPSRYYFLRWVHRVSGFEAEPKEFPSPEGTMHTPNFEVRWQQTKQGYDLLLLCVDKVDEAWGFQAIAADWVTSEPLDAHLHPKGALQAKADDRQDTRFPKPFIYPDRLKLQQRYFQNQQTGTVHFVALTLAQSEVQSDEP
ncbi:MAG: hypothetical protein VKJ24_13640 [Synechococcales bacterium]|nr:hypothetical protein [Synechococcales bacterium]